MVFFPHFIRVPDVFLFYFFCFYLLFIFLGSLFCSFSQYLYLGARYEIFLLTINTRKKIKRLLWEL